MIAQRNKTNLVITNTDAATTALPVAVGEFGVRRIGELLCDASALVAGDQFQVLYMGADSKVVETPMYSWSDLVFKSKMHAVAAASQVSTIGYNGTDGDIVATNYGNYLVTIGFKDMLKMTGNKRLYKYAEYIAGASAKNYDVAIGLAGSLESNMSKDAFKRVVPEAVCSFAQVNGDCFDDDVYVVKGSKYLTFATSSVYSTAEQIVVGDYVRLGAASVAPTVASPVYRVVAVDLTGSDTVTLDRPVTNATGTYVEGSYDAVVIRKADAEAATTKWGIILTANDADAPFDPGKYGDNRIQFSLGVSTNFGTTEVRLGTKPSLGVGTLKSIQMLDWELRTQNREKYRIAEYPVSFLANIDGSFGTIHYVSTFQFRDRSTDALGSIAESYMTLVIASTSTSDTNLNTIFSTTGT